MYNSNEHHTEEELVARSIEIGAMEDQLDVKSLAKWTVITIIFVLGLIFTGFELYKGYSYKVAEELGINAQYSDLINAKTSVKERLSTYGVVDETKKIYHIPIDKAIDLTVQAYQSK
ncbi:hypothetical protein EP331_01200 [bacterium]|nr:MAG: hypothetical protein EP331_01200 [bacterium]